MRGAALVAVWLALAGGAAAAGLDAPGSERRPLEPAEAGAFRAVGRLNIDGSRFCTATLIAERLVLTAAHCLFDPDTGAAVPLGDLRFEPGGQRKRDRAVWRVARQALAPGFVLVETPGPADLRTDIALLEMEAPVPVAIAAPFVTGPFLRDDAPPRIVSYAQDRSRKLSINDACPPLGRIEEVLVVACAIEHGVSGAPVLAGEGAQTRVVAVVSSMGRLPGGGAFTLSVVVAPWIDALRSRLEAGGPR